jgi:hypothetical protein
LYSWDPIEGYLNHGDLPILKIKKMIREIFPKEDADYIFSLEGFIKYTHVMGERFWARMDRPIGAL